VFTARGEVITVPAEKGDARHITNSLGVMERDPQWSPDGRWIAYLDESGEYALHLYPQTGTGEVKKIALQPGFYLSPRSAADSKKVALVDSFQHLWYVDIESGKQVEVAHPGDSEWGTHLDWMLLNPKWRTRVQTPDILEAYRISCQSSSPKSQHES
jgi:tricorn protease-like protein